VALAVALLVLFLVALCLALLALSLYVRMRAVRDESQGIVLRALADAALAEGLADLAAHPGSTGLTEHPFGGGRIGSRTFPLDDNRYRVVATGRLGGRSRTVEAQVLRTPYSLDVTSWRVLPPRSEGSEEGTGSRPR
jgi:hypothetical protein